jgi:hypothetical protein
MIASSRSAAFQVATARATASRSSATPSTRSARAATTINPRMWDYHCHANSVGIASSLRADMIFGKDNRGNALLPGWKNACSLTSLIIVEEDVGSLSLPSEKHQG